jgi:hypothetical protein
MIHTIDTSSPEFLALDHEDKELLLAWIETDDMICSTVAGTLRLARSNFLGKYASAEEYAEEYVREVRRNPDNPKYIKENITVADVATDFNSSTRSHNGYYFGYYAVTERYLEKKRKGLVRSHTKSVA